MAEQVSFKTRVKDTAIRVAPDYYSYYVCRDYLLMSDSFKSAPYYIVRAQKDNYLHLVGVSTKLSATAFFDKCMNGTLDESDFEITAHGQDKKQSKGSIRRKIKSLPLITGLFTDSSLIEENFKKNTVLCTFASSDGSCTLGFIATPSARPKTLLEGDELDHTKAKNLKIVLSKARDDTKFSTVIVGTNDDLISVYDSIKDLISEDIDKRIVYATVSKQSRSEAFIAKSQETLVEKPRVSIHDRLEAGKKRSQEQYTRPAQNYDTRSLDKDASYQ